MVRATRWQGERSLSEGALDTHLSHPLRSALNVFSRSVNAVLFPVFPRRKPSHSSWRHAFGWWSLSEDEREAEESASQGERGWRGDSHYIVHHLVHAVNEPAREGQALERRRRRRRRQG